MRWLNASDFSTDDHALGLAGSWKRSIHRVSQRAVSRKWSIAQQVHSGKQKFERVKHYLTFNCPRSCSTG